MQATVTEIGKHAIDDSEKMIILLEKLLPIP